MKEGSVLLLQYTPECASCRNHSETQPNAGRNQPGDKKGITIEQEFTIEAQHASVFVPFDADRPGRAAHAFEVRNLRLWNEEYPEALTPESHAPVHVLAMQEIAIVKMTYYFHGAAPHEHESA